MKPLRTLCVNHRCPTRRKCYRYVAKVTGLPTYVFQLKADQRRCIDFLKIPPGVEVKDVK